jgi:hypothetical protein
MSSLILPAGGRSRPRTEGVRDWRPQFCVHPAVRDSRSQVSSNVRIGNGDQEHLDAKETIDELREPFVVPLQSNDVQCVNLPHVPCTQTFKLLSLYGQLAH